MNATDDIDANLTPDAASTEAASGAKNPERDPELGAAETSVLGRAAQDGAAAESAAPEAYEPFALPEGLPADESALQAASAAFRELGLTQDQAQKLVDLHAGQVKAQMDAWAERQEAWIGEIKSDREIGGARLERNLSYAAKALDQFGSPALRQALDESGLGNHPELVRFAIRIGKVLAEDRMVPAGGGGQRPAADVMFPSMSKEF